MEKPRNIVVADIGGTNARFALARLEGRRVAALGEAVTLPAADYASLPRCWEAFARAAGEPLPREASIAVASPVGGEVIQFTNSPWVIRPGSLAGELGLDRLLLLNDFAAVGHAVPQLAETDFVPLCGPDEALPEAGVISIVGPGTGLGVSHVVRAGGRSHVIGCEGGHIDFAPLDALEDALLARLRKPYRRVSVERIVSGPGLSNIYQVLAEREGVAVRFTEDRELWASALDGSDELAAAALARFCLCLGAVAGDVTLAQGGVATVIAGGVGLRLRDYLPGSGFGLRFTAKGRFERMMAGVPVKLLVHPQPGLFGAAAAFATAE